MKLTFALMLVPALLLAGCTRERVIERPVIIAPAAAGATGAAACVYASQAYAHGSVSCQDRVQYQCENGIWNRTPNAC